MVYLWLKKSFFLPNLPIENLALIHLPMSSQSLPSGVSLTRLAGKSGEEAGNVRGVTELSLCLYTYKALALVVCEAQEEAAKDSKETLARLMDILFLEQFELSQVAWIAPRDLESDSLKFKSVLCYL